jgi:hypothetical protein
MFIFVVYDLRDLRRSGCIIFSVWLCSSVKLGTTYGITRIVTHETSIYERTTICSPTVIQLFMPLVACPLTGPQHTALNEDS